MSCLFLIRDPFRGHGEGKIWVTAGPPLGYLPIHCRALYEHCSRVAWQSSGPFPYYQNTFHILSSPGLEPRTFCFSAQFPPDRAHFLCGTLKQDDNVSSFLSSNSAPWKVCEETIMLGHWFLQRIAAYSLRKVAGCSGVFVLFCEWEIFSAQYVCVSKEVICKLLSKRS